MLSLQDMLIAVVLLVLFVSVGFLLRALIDIYALPWAGRYRSSFAEVILRSLRGMAPLWMALAGVAVALRWLQMPVGVILFGDQVLISVLIVSVTLLALRLLASAILLFGERVEGMRQITGVVERIAQVVVVTLGLLTLMGYLNIPIAPLLTGLGVAGLATALALQDTLANFFAGLYVLADRPVRTGDYVRLNENEVEGYVVDVGWRSTRIRTLPNNIVVVPNQKLAQSVITNFHLPETRMSLLLPLNVTYSSDPVHVEQVLVDVAKESAGEIDGLLAEPPPFVRFIPGFGDYSLGFTLICQVREFVDQYAVQHELRKRILARFQREGIQIPFPIQTIHLADGSAGGRASDDATAGRVGHNGAPQSASGGSTNQTHHGGDQ